MSITRSSLRQESQSAMEFSESHKRYSFFVFVDPFCGLGCGRAFLKLEVTILANQTERICFILDGESESDRTSDKERRLKYDIHTHFYDMSCGRSMEMACERLKIIHNQKHRKVRVIVCGDESSLCDVAMFCENKDLAIENYPFGLIPSGCVNDLSSVLGWGDTEPEQLVGQDLKFIKGLARKWVKAIIQKIDIWTVTVQVHPEDGAIQTVDKQVRVKVYEKEKVLETLMISHLNIGVHARIDLGFDQKKSNESGLANKWIHAFQGFKKMMCMSTKVDKMVSIVEIEAKENGEQQTFKTLFSAKKQKDKGPELKYLSGSPVSLVCLNIGSYRGNPQVWKNAEQSDNNELHKRTQSYYDGKLQFVTYNSIASTQATRVCQTQGNININLQRDNPTYIQIDGACFKLTSPKQITITKRLKLQVLINSDSLK